MDNLVNYRLDNAKEKLESAKLLLDGGKYRDSIGRSYYAIFTAVRAVLANDKVDFSKHSGVIAYFQKEYIKTGKFDVKYSRYLQTAFQPISSSLCISEIYLALVYCEVVFSCHFRSWIEVCKSCSSKKCFN